MKIWYKKVSNNENWDTFVMANRFYVVYALPLLLLLIPVSVGKKFKNWKCAENEVLCIP